MDKRVRETRHTEGANSSRSATTNREISRTILSINLFQGYKTLKSYRFSCHEVKWIKLSFSCHEVK